MGLCRWRRGAAEQVKVKVKVQSAECRVQSAECRVQSAEVQNLVHRCTGAADMVVLKC